MNVARNWTGDLGTHIHQTSTKRCKNLASAGLKEKALKQLEVLKVDPYQTPPPYEKLIGDLAGAYSRRINIQHRLVYQVLEAEKHIKILRMWTHYE